MRWPETEPYSSSARRAFVSAFAGEVARAARGLRIGSGQSNSCAGSRSEGHVAAPNTACILLKLTLLLPARVSFQEPGPVSVSDHPLTANFHAFGCSPVSPGS